MIRTVEIKKCDTPGMILSGFVEAGGGALKELTAPATFLHGHVSVDGKDWGTVGSKADVRAIVQKRVESDELGESELQLFEDALTAAEWLPEKTQSGIRFTGSQDAFARSAGSFNGLVRLLVDMMMDMSAQTDHASEVQARLARYLLEKYPPRLRLYRSENRQMGMLQVLGTEHTPIVDMRGFSLIVENVTKDGSPLKPEDFNEIHEELLQAGFPFVEGKVVEGFTEFVERDGEDKIGELVDANGSQIVGVSKFGLLRTLTGNGSVKSRFSPDRIGEHMDRVNASRLPTTVLSRKETVDLGDGYFAEFTYGGDKLVEVQAGYKAPAIAEGKAEEDAGAAPTGNGDGEDPLQTGLDTAEALSGEPAASAEEPAAPAAEAGS